MYEVVYRFADLKDGSYVYEVGAKYPREGYSPTSERIAELSGSKNKIGKVLIVKKEQETETKTAKEQKKKKNQK